jgi:hypothetical protein
MSCVPNDDVPAIPNRLRDVFARWDRDGRKGQGGMSWNRVTWRSTLPKHDELFASLPDRIDRSAVLNRVAGAADGEV